MIRGAGHNKLLRKVMGGPQSFLPFAPAGPMMAMPKMGAAPRMQRAFVVSKQNPARSGRGSIKTGGGQLAVRKMR